MSLEERIRELVDKANRKMESDEKMRESVKNLTKTFNVVLTGETPEQNENYSFRLENARISDLKTEAAEKADVTLKCSIENMVKLLDGDLRPMKAYVTKKISISGSIQDLMVLKKFFRNPRTYGGSAKPRILYIITSRDRACFIGHDVPPWHG